MQLNKLRLPLAAAVVLALLALGGLPARAAGSTTVANLQDMQGWFFVNESTAATVAAARGTLVGGPAAPPAGTGSAWFKLTNSGAGMGLSRPSFAGTPLAGITRLEYSTYRTLGGPAQAIALQFAVDYNAADADTNYQGRLVFEPSAAGSPATGAWQTWNALAGKWWATFRAGYTGHVSCPQSTPCTWTQVLTLFPQAAIHSSPAHGGLWLKAGGGWANFEGAADNLTVGVLGEDATYDFERGTTLTVDDDRAQCPGAAYTTISAAMVDALAGDTVGVCAGNYNENVVISKNNLTLIGAGAGTDTTQHTLVDGNTPANKGALPGIQINGNVTGVTIKNLRVQDFATRSGIYASLANNNFTVEDVHAVNNGPAGAAQGGVFMNGPVNTVLIKNVLAENNRSRGIAIWNGFKQNITFVDNVVRGNNCCGIELQDGSASGVTVSGNLVENNADSGMSFVGLRSGAGPNLITGNTLVDNGRFGIEIKLPNGTGLESGDGSIVVSGNDVQRTAPPADLRDLAGIAAYRRGWVAGNNNVDIPTGVVIKNNTVGGYTQPSSSDGFGIVVEGVNVSVYGNTVGGSDVGIQRQAGHLPYTANTNVDGDQTNLADLYFGRGNSPVVCATIGANTYSANGLDRRDAGPIGAGCDSTGPLTTGVLANPNPVEAGMPIALTAGVDDNPAGGSNVAAAEYSVDGGAWQPMGAQDGAFDEAAEAVAAIIPAFAAVGSHEVCVRGGDAIGNTGAAACITLAVGPAQAAVTLGDLLHTYDGTSKFASASVVPSFCGPVNLAYSQASVPVAAPTNAGSYDVAASLSNANCEIASGGSGTLVIQEAQAAVTLSDLLHTYDGTPKSASAGVVPAFCGPVNLAYSQASVPVAAPTNAGSYDMAASLANANCEIASGGTGTLVIQKANQAITFAAIPNKTVGDPPFAVNPTASSGLPVALSAAGPCTVSGNTVTLTGAGTCTITATQGGDDNYNAAPTVQRSFSIGYALCVLSDLGKPARSGSTIVIRVQLCDANGANLSAASITLQAVSVSGPVSGPPQAPGNSNPDNLFSYSNAPGGAGSYQYELKTTGYTAGTYTLSVQVAGDPLLRTVQFVIR